MADFGGGGFSETENLDVSQIILIQAALRGALVRRWMKEVKQAFGDAFAQIERNSAVELEWKSDQLCKPRVGRTKDKLRKKSEKKKDEPATVQSTDLNDLSRKVSNSKNIKKKEPIVTDLLIEGRADVVPGESDESLLEKPKNVNESPKYNSVEIQPCFIDINFQSLPDKLKKESEEVSDKEENFLEDLDTSWKDRVEPFLQNNFGEPESMVELKKDGPNADELHLDLDIDTESLHSQKSSQQSSKNTERLEDYPVLTANSDDSVKRKGPSDNEKHNGFEYEKTESGRKTSMSRKSERSDSSPRRKNNKGDELTRSGQRSSRSDEYSSESRKRASKTSQRSKEREVLPHSSWSDKRSEKDQLSNRSDKSSGRSQRLIDTERFSPRGQRSSNSEISESGSKKSRESEKGLEGQLTHRSDRSDGGGKLSHRSDGSLSHRSDRSGDRKSQSSQRSRQGEGQKSERSEENEKKYPQQSRASPVEFQRSRRDRWNEESPIQGRPPLQDSTNLTNVTSVWDSFSSVRDSHDVEMPDPLPQDPAKLKELRKNIAMELLWVQQAIDSRKNYLKLKGKM